jgi:hypothetical protein
MGPVPTLAVAFGLLGVAVVGFAGWERPVGPTSMEVALPPLRPAGQGLTGEEAAAALAPFAADPTGDGTDPSDRLRCRPRGCERWWSPGTVMPVAPAVLDDLLVVAFRDGLAAIDPASGERRWEVPIGELQPDQDTGWELRTSELTLRADSEDLVVWSPRGYLQLRGADGTPRWSITLPDTRRMWAAELTDEVVIVSRTVYRRTGPTEEVTGFDRRSGTARWRQRVRWTYATGPAGALVRTADDRAASLDPRSGQVAFHLDVDAPRWVAPLGAFIVARVGLHEVALLDPSDGQVVREVPDVAGVADLHDPTGAIALLLTTQDGDGTSDAGTSDAGTSDAGTSDTASARVLAVDGDGSERWVHELGCCARMVSSPPGTVAVQVDGDEPPSLLAAEDGAVLDRPLSARPHELRWVSREVLVAPGARTSTLLDRDGARIALDGGRARVLHADPLIVASRDGLLALDRSAAVPLRRPRVGPG